MKLGEMRKLLADLPDEAEINFADGNFGGYGDDITEHTFSIDPENNEVLLKPPYWMPLED